MASSEFAALGGALAQLVSIIQDLGNDHFQADASWKEFSLRVQLLQDTHDDLEEKMQRYGLRQNAFVEAVKEAKKLLDGEIAQLEERRAKRQASTWPSSAIRRILFPASAGLHIGVAEGAYSKISVHLNTQLQNDNVLAETAQRRPFLLPFHYDRRYVPRDTSEKMVYSALEEAGTRSAVVLLSGGPGKGKSTLARQVSLRYRDGNSTFTQVVMVECGPKMDVAAKQIELLQKLGGDLSQQSQGLDFKVLKSLQDRLSNPKMLIILDDLWDPELVFHLVNLSESGSGAKFLITSQVGNICANLNCRDTTLVQIEDLNQEEARKILASHAGFEDQKIPHHLRDVSDKLIAQAEANPLVVATLGAQIAKAVQDKMEVWESVLDDLVDSVLLYGETPVKVHDNGYQRSFLATMKIAIDDLHHKQKQLVLIGTCRGPSMSKSALQFLHSSAILQKKCNIRDFLHLVNDLKSRHLLAEKDAELLSIHSLTKRFILDQMRDSVKDVMTMLHEATFHAKGKASKSNIKSFVTHVLVYLYIDPDVSRRAITQNHDPSSDSLISNESQFNNATIELKRTTSESIMQLLVLEARPSNKWTDELSMCANQVLVDFACDDLLCDRDISKLLASSTAITPMLTFLKNVCLLEKPFWKKNFIQTTSIVPYHILNFLQDDSCAEHQMQVASVLADLCWCWKDNCETIANTPGMLSQLAKSLKQGQNSDLQIYAARAVSACAYWDDTRYGTVISKIVDVPGLINSLVDRIDKDKNPGVQSAVAHALNNLASGSRNGELVAWPGLLEMLVRALNKGCNHLVQENAASCLANIAHTDDNTILNKLFNYPGLVDKLVRSLYEDQNSGLQSESARALACLAKYHVGSSIRNKLVSWPGLLDGLAESLLKAQNLSLQVHAADAISNLALVIEKEVADTIVNHPALMDNLVTLLDESQSFCVQAVAVGALLQLTDIGEVSLKAKIWSFPRWLDSLVELLLKAPSPSLQLTAAKATVILTAKANKDTVDKLLKHPGLVDNVVKLLDERGDSGVQVEGAAALFNLTCDGDDNLRTKLVNFPPFLGKLTASLLKGESSRLESVS